jgi:hypothetical protein
VAQGIRPVQEIDRAPNVTGSAPAAIVELGPITSAAFNNAAMDLTFRLVVLTGRASERAARLKLDALTDTDPGSTTALARTLSGDLGGAVAFCEVSVSSEYRNYPMGDPAIEYLGCEFTVVIGT